MEVTTLWILSINIHIGGLVNLLLQMIYQGKESGKVYNILCTCNLHEKPWGECGLIWHFWGRSRGVCRMCAPPPPHLRVTCGFLIQLVFCIKICFHHQSVTPFLGAAPCHKKNPGPAPDFVLVSAMVSAKTRIFYCDLSKPCCYYWGPVRVKFWQATWP